jgi:hypothetical protein
MDRRFASICIVFIVMAATLLLVSQQMNTPECGDGECDPSEDWGACPEDCGKPNDSEAAIELHNPNSPFGLHGAENDIDAMAAAGIKWHRPGFHPGATFPSKTDVFDERYVNFFGNGIDVLANLLVFSGENGCLPSDPEEYREIVRQIVERYDGDGIDDALEINGTTPVVRYWQIGNEVDSTRGPQSCTPEEYIEALKYYYPMIKENGHDCKVVMSGLVTDPINFLDSVLELGGGEYYDVNDVHIFGNKDYYLGIPAVYRDLKDVQERHGYDKEIWILETGTFSGGTNSNVQSEEEQAAAMVKVYASALGSGFRKVFWAWGLYEGFGGDGNGFFDQTGLIYDGKGEYDKGEGVRKKAYYTYKVMASKLEGCNFSEAERISHVNENVFVYRFPKENGTMYVVWREHRQGVVIDPNSTTSIEVFGESAEITNALTDENGDLESYTTAIINNTLELNLNKGPVFAFVIAD